MRQRGQFQTRSHPASSHTNNFDGRKLKKAIRALFGNDKDQKQLCADGLEACKRMGIKPEELQTKTVQDFIDKNNPN